MNKWKVGKYGRMINFDKYPEGSPAPIVITPSGKKIAVESTEQAELLVRAVNSHDELVAALQELCFWIVENQNSIEGEWTVRELLGDARAALAHAKGEE
jgi:hypothetical protein